MEKSCDNNDNKDKEKRLMTRRSFELVNLFQPSVAFYKEASQYLS